MYPVAVRTSTLPDAPRYEYAWATLVCVLAVLTLAHPALVGQFLVGSHSDQYIAGYAFREFAASHLREHGSFPQWNPYLFGGMPYVAAMHGDIFYPTFLLRLILPTDVAMTWGFIIHLVLAGVLTFGFLRAVGLSFGGALAGGLAYMLGGQLASLVSPGHDGKLFVSALFPLALLLLVRWIRDGRRWAPGALAIVVGLAVLSPHPQLLQYMLLGSAAYALYIAIRGVRTGSLDARATSIRLGIALLAVLLGGLIGAIQFLPVREYVAWSPRAGGIADYAAATSYAWPPEELLDAYLPQFSGILDAYWGRNGIHLHSQYVGASVIALGAAAFMGFRGDTRRSEILFWTGALVMALLWALGGHTPFYRLPYAIVPGTKFFRAPATIFFIGAFAIAYLTAIGAERLLAGKIGKVYVIGWGIAALSVAVLASVGALSGVAQTFAPPGLDGLAAANHSAIVTGAWRSAVAVAAILALASLVREGRVPGRAAVWVLAALITADLWSVMRHYWHFSPPAERLFTADATTEYLRRQDQPARVLALSIPPGAVGRDANIAGDGLMVHGIRTTLGYHGNQLARYDRLAGRHEGYAQLGNPQFWGLSNTQYVLTNLDTLPLPGATRVAGPATTAAGNSVSLHRLGGEQPYAWVAPLSVKAPDDAVLGTVLDPRFNLGTAALFDPDAPVSAVEAGTIEALPEPLTIQARVARYAAGSVDLELDAPAPEGAALVVSENYYPGWRATADGQPAAIGRVNYTFIGVELPQGARTVQLVFDSPTYERGKVITLLALLVALGWFIVAAVFQRRARGATVA